MDRLLEDLQMLGKDLHPFEDQQEKVLQEVKDQDQFLLIVGGKWYKWIDVEVELSTNELGQFVRGIKRFEVIFDDLVHFLRHLPTIKKYTIAYVFVMS